MIDIHCHILPGIDDGPGTMDESLEMCRIAASDGIKTIVATPHFNPGRYEPHSAEVFKLINALQARVNEEGLDIRILPGADVSITPELQAQLKSEMHLTINKKGKYIVLEFPSAYILPNWKEFLLSLLDFGIVPIISHPERNAWFINHPRALFPVVRQGVIVQITGMSVTGEFGDDARRCSIFLLKNNLAHVIATDAHSSTYRSPLLTNAVSAAADLIGKDRAQALVTSIPRAIIEGKPVVLPEPFEPPEEKKGWLKKIINRI